MSILSRLKRSGVNAEAGNRPYVSTDDYPTQMRKRTQKKVNDISPQVQSELVRPYKDSIKSYAEHEYYQVPPPGIEPWPIPTFPPIPLPSFRVQTPIFSVASGSYPSAQTVHIVCLTAGATIYYTLDNSEPTVHKTKYVTPLIISADTTLKARAFKDGMDPSTTSVGIYTVGSNYHYCSDDTDCGGVLLQTNPPPDVYTWRPGDYWSGLYVGQSGTDYSSDVYFRFPNIAIPQGKIITSAYLTIEVYNQMYDKKDLKIYLNDIDTAVSPTSVATFQSLAKTTASVVWSSAVAVGLANTPDIKSVVQEAIDRPGWTSGNALMVILESQAIDPPNEGLIYYRTYRGARLYGFTQPSLYISY